MRRLALGIFVASLLTGCATTLTQGLDLTSKGLKTIDVATEHVVDDYSSAVTEVREYCAQLEEPHANKCMNARGVAPGDVQKALAGAQRMSDAYDEAAKALELLRQAWSELQPELSKVQK